MPPRAKYSREKIVEVSRKIVEEKGLEGLTAREISSRLGSTTAPIFTYFGSMEELSQAVYMDIAAECRDILLDSLNYYPSLKEFGVRWVRYARENPRYYEMLFLLRGQNEAMTAQTRNGVDVLMELLAKRTAETLRISIEQANVILRKMVFFVSGICISIVSGIASYSDEEVASMISECGVMLVNFIYFQDGTMTYEKTKAMFSSIEAMPVQIDKADKFPGYDNINIL